MSMIGQFIRVTDAELQAYLQDSSLLEERLDSVNGNEERFFDVDKSWDALSFLLTGHTMENVNSATPRLSWTIFGNGTVDSEQELGYGPAKYLTSDEVQAVHRALSSLSVPELMNRYDAKELNSLHIYPEHWEDSSDCTAYLADYFEDLKAFYAKAALEHQAMIHLLT
ncbi:MAG TPA: YfbM family protein [Puia sp.]|nr:YfbM family protein [Puia sp.]